MISTFLKRASKLTIDNSPVLLTGIGVVGTISTAVLSGRASFKAAQLIQAEYDSRLENWAEGTKPGVEQMSNREKAKLVWTMYIPSFSSGVLTITCIIGAQRIGMRRTAALAAAYSLSERAFVDYREKVVERLGANKEQNIRDEIAQDRIDKHPVSKNQVFITGPGKVLCFESITGRYFESDMEALRKAQNDLNQMILHDSYATLYDFHTLIGLPPTAYSGEIGWNTSSMCELKFSTCLSEDGRPCISVEYAAYPIRDYY